MTGPDLDRYGVWIAIAVMAVVTFLIRAGGFWLMGHVPLTPRLRRMLEVLPGAVVMALRCNDLLAVFCGLAIAAALRAAL